jgi:hypothetical protein
MERSGYTRRSVAGKNVSNPSHEYSARLEKFVEALAASHRKHILLGNAKLGIIGGGLVFVWLSLAKEWFSAYWLVIPLCVYITLAARHEQILRGQARAQTAAEFYRKGLARIEDRWAGTGQTGDRFLEQAHVYAARYSNYSQLPDCRWEKGS